jgi:hypothetical protein
MRTLPFVVALLILSACDAPDNPDPGTVDQDGDGSPVSEDCNDADPRVFPGNPEVCDGVDNNCNAAVDDGDDRTTYYADADNDGFGDPKTSVLACIVPDGHVADNTDCNDADGRFNPLAVEADCTDPADYNCDGSVGYEDADNDGVPACEDCDDASAAVKPDAVEVCNNIDDNCDRIVDLDAADRPTFYPDADGDSFGNTRLPVLACEAPAGHVVDGTDCDDASNLSYPGAPERCDAEDNNCDGAAGGDEVDADSDTFLACEECNDRSAAVFPGADETCNKVDDDCDGTIDESAAIDAVVWYRDADKDGWGTSSGSVRACVAPRDHVDRGGDCDDGNADANPGEDERCNKVDDDCDGATDEASAIDAGTWYADADADGWGAGAGSRACVAPAGQVSRSGDCDDKNKDANPAQDELCSTTFDDDCDGRTNEPSAVDAADWYKDGDKDGYGDPTVRSTACTAPAGYVSAATDCRDTDPLVYPGAGELCSTTYDDDCDGSVNESDAKDTKTWYADADGDRYGSPKVTTKACTAPSGFVVDDKDCDDADDKTYPGAEDVCDGVDNDCTGLVDDDDAYLGSDKLCPADTCNDLLAVRSSASDGTYWVDPSGSAPVLTYCDMTTDGGGWTLASYAYNGSAATDSTNHNHWSLKCGGGTFAPTARGTSSASFAAVDLAQASTEMAISMNLSGGSVTTGNMKAYDRAYSFKIPDPSAVTFVNHAYNGGSWGTGSSQAGACTAVTVKGLVGDTSTYSRYTLKHSLGATWTDSYPTGYGATSRSSCVGPGGSSEGPFVHSYHSGDGWGGSHGITVKSCDISTAGRTQYNYLGTWSATSNGFTGSNAIWFR